MPDAAPPDPPTPSPARTYEGRLHVRMAERGILLGDAEDEPDVHDWLARVLGLDTYLGTPRGMRVRITVEKLED